MAGTATCRRGPDGRNTRVRDRLPRHKAESLLATGLEIAQWTLATKAGGETATIY